MYIRSLGTVVAKAQGHLSHNAAFSRRHIHTSYINHRNNLFGSYVFGAL